MRLHPETPWGDRPKVTPEEEPLTFKGEAVAEPPPNPRPLMPYMVVATKGLVEAKTEGFGETAAEAVADALAWIEECMGPGWKATHWYLDPDRVLAGTFPNRGQRAMQ